MSYKLSAALGTSLSLLKSVLSKPNSIRYPRLNVASVFKAGATASLSRFRRGPCSRCSSRVKRLKRSSVIARNLALLVCSWRSSSSTLLTRHQSERSLRTMAQMEEEQEYPCRKGWSISVSALRADEFALLLVGLRRILLSLVVRRA